MDKHRQTEEAPDKRDGVDQSLTVPDRAPWLGQVGEGATEPSGEAIAREVRELTHPPQEKPQISADPEMPTPDPDER